MVKSIEKYKLAVRITADNDDALLEIASRYTGIWCKESADNEKHCTKPHYHGMIEMDITVEGLRKQIYNAFSVPKENQGNKTVAFSKVTDAPGFERYICKGTNKTLPVILYNNTDCKPEITYDEYWDVNKELKKSIEEKRAEKGTHKEQFKVYFKEKHVKENQSKYRCRLTKKDLVKIMYYFYLEKGWEMPSSTQGETVIYDLWLRYCGQEEDAVKEAGQYWRIF